jgi:lauroyl/myristoyl acyltransferase
VQYLLARPSRLTDRLHRWAIRRWFPVLARVAPRWPRWWEQLHSRWVMFLIMVIYPHPKRMVRRNLAHVLGSSAGSWRVRRACSIMLRHFAYQWVDLFRYAQMPVESAQQEVLDEITGHEHLRDAVDAGQGVVLLTGHLGNWELGGVLLGRERLPISVVYVKDKFGDLEHYRGFLRRQGDIEEIPIAPGGSWSSLPVLRALRAGRVVAMQGDRDFDGRGIAATFFGERVLFPRGPFLVALLTGAPIVPAFITYTAKYQLAGEFAEPIRVASGGDRDAALAAAVQRWADILEEQVRRCPTQWYTFYDFFAQHRVREEDEAEAAMPLQRASA